jgi:hypothetical protein
MVGMQKVSPTKFNTQLLFRKLYNGTIYITVLKETNRHYCVNIVLLAVGRNATCFDPFLGSSSGVQEYWN